MKKLKKKTQTQNNPTDLKYPKPDKSNLIFMPIVETGKQQMMPDGSHQYVLCISKKGQDPLQSLSLLQLYKSFIEKFRQIRIDQLPTILLHNPDEFQRYIESNLS
jgi:hypothetical protein